MTIDPRTSGFTLAPGAFFGGAREATPFATNRDSDSGNLLTAITGYHLAADNKGPNRPFSIADLTPEVMLRFPDIFFWLDT
jgi:hypothetical protein